MKNSFTFNELRESLVGLNEKVPLLDGTTCQYINFDNGASTPTFTHVLDRVQQFLKWYSNVHRGTGFKSQIASWAFDSAREITAEFVKVDLQHNTVLFTKNTTESINKLAHHFNFKDDDVVLTSLMEHHSNDLPWRQRTNVIHVGINSDGSLDMNDFKKKLSQCKNNLRLVTITGASNVTGFLTPIHEIAQLTHAAGAEIMVDAAQLAPHRPIDMLPDDDPGHIDYLAFSAHKMYAPFGVGVLVGKKKRFLESEPDHVGGGMVDLVTLEQAYWSDLPDREEAGTPDITGVVALASTIKLIEHVGWDFIIDHEKKLTAYALKKLQEVPGMAIYGSRDASKLDNRLGVISFNLDGFPHALVSAILSYEGGIGVRDGCFCAHLYLLNLLRLTDTEVTTIREEILRRDRTHVPGTIRVSFGMYNSEEEIDRLVELLHKISRNEYKGHYILDPKRGEYHPKELEYKFTDYFRFDVNNGNASSSYYH